MRRGVWGSVVPQGWRPVWDKRDAILCYAIMLPSLKASFRAGFRPDSNRENNKIGPPAGRRPVGGPILKLSRLESGRNPARKPDFRPGGNIASHRVTLTPPSPFPPLPRRPSQCPFSTLNSEIYGCGCNSSSFNLRFSEREERGERREERSQVRPQSGPKSTPTGPRTTAN